MLLLAAATLLVCGTRSSAGAGECTVTAPPQLQKASPLLFGMNDVLGPIINLTYRPVVPAGEPFLSSPRPSFPPLFRRGSPCSDAALVDAVRRLGVGALRHPGGTVANFWTMANGSYVGLDGTSAGGNSVPPPPSRSG